MEKILTLSTLIFVVATLLNVILQTMKSVLTLTASRKVAALMNAIAFGFYAIIIKSTSEIDLVVSIPVTMFGNLVGVYVALWILNKFKKDKLWRITVTTRSEDAVCDITNALEKYNIGYNIMDCHGKMVIDIFSYTQGESILIKEILAKENVKYCVMEMNKNL